MTTPASKPVEAATTESLVLAHPLDEFYAQAGQPLPPLQQIDGEGVPQPYKSLLVHQDDMTPTLEKFHRRDIHLRVLGRRRVGDAYYREVALLLDETNEPVEFGAIKINLDRFNPHSQEQILTEVRPLGHILNQDGIAHASRPKAFLRVASDKLINEALELHGAHILFGRRNTLFDTEGQPIAEIVEILPPWPRPQAAAGSR
jgi:chorismate-pyruvate lyase